MIVLIIFDILIEKLKNAVRFEKKRFDKVKESTLFLFPLSLSALILSMLRPSHAAIADFKLIP